MPVHIQPADFNNITLFVATLTVQRRECKDWLCVYRIEDWGQHARFLLDTTDAADIAWAPNGATIAVWDSVLYYKVTLVLYILLVITMCL